MRFILLPSLLLIAAAPDPDLAAPRPVFQPEVFFAGRTEGHAHLKVLFRSTKPVHVIGRGHLDRGTLVLNDLKPGKHLYLLGTGTGLAPFLSIIRDPETYDRFEKIVLVHGVRNVNDLAYRDYLENELPQHEYLGELVREKLLYYPTVTREPFRHQGRITDAIVDGQMSATLGLPPLNPETDRVMLCGSPAMLVDLCALLDGRGFQASPRTREPGDYVIERAFVEK